MNLFPFLTILFSVTLSALAQDFVVTTINLGDPIPTDFFITIIDGTTFTSFGATIEIGTTIEGTTATAEIQSPEPTDSVSTEGTSPSAEDPTSDVRKSDKPTTTTSKNDQIATKAVTTTYAPFVASVSGKAVTLINSGEVVPLRTAEAQQPAPSSFTDGIISELSKEEDLTAFTGLLKQAPELLRSLDPAKKYRFYAPTNEFVAAFLANNNLPETPLLRREVYVSPAVAQQVVEQPEGEPDFKNVEYTLKTAMKGETKYVDLGNDEPARVVSLPAQLQDPPGKEGDVLIISGEGNKTAVKPDTIPFKYGVIQKTDGFFHYPQYLEQTLAATTGKKFEAALNDTRMLEDLSAKPGVTIFAVQDSGFTGTPDEQLLKRHVHENLAYSPELSDGLCLDTQGGSILTVTHKGKDKFVNGAKIVRSNVITRNGVIHYLEKFAEKGRDGGCAVAKAGNDANKNGAKSKGVSLAALGVALNVVLYIVG